MLKDSLISLALTLLAEAILSVAEYLKSKLIQHINRHSQQQQYGFE